MRWNMKNKDITSTWWFSVIISLLIIGFLLVLTTGVYNLILKELYDNRDMWNSIKAYAWAESAQELALLEIKEKWYGYDTQMINSPILSVDVPISYDLDMKTKTYSAILNWLEYDIVPLFYIDENGIQQKLDREYTLDVLSWEINDWVWNLISEISWISWKFWSSSSMSSFWDVSSFLGDPNNTNIYLVLFNSWNAQMSYKLTSTQFFSKPEIEIITSATVGKVKQNLWTTLDNTEYLNILKYSIYSN